MPSLSPSRLVRRTLFAATLLIPASLFVSACAANDATQSAPPVTQVDAGDLTGLDVDLHQAVG